MQAVHHHPPGRCEAFPARSSPHPGPRTTCCCLGALRPSLKKFTPHRASPERLECAFQPKLPRGRTIGAAWGPGARGAAAKFQAGLPETSPVIPHSAGPRIPGGWLRGACAQKGKQPALGAGGGGNFASRLARSP